ncbi:lipoprotein-releasing ABC transporter permease subunit LolC [Orbaceae bacterium ESL0721]|nr:lipoprotein-releasing ABC transporter permease subunit LolC [Orbaceae bacterium ESL0721]
MCSYVKNVSPVNLFISFRYIYGQKNGGFGRFVSWLSMLGIMLGSLGLIVVLSVMNGLENQMQNNILRFLPQAEITSSQYRINTHDLPRQQFTTIPNVNQITPLITSDVVLQSEHGITVTTLMGVDPNEYDPVRDYIYWGDLNDLQAGQYNIIIGYQLADQLKVTVGDKIRLMVTEASQVTPVGRIPSQRLFTITGIFNVNHDINRSLIYINQTDAKNLLRYPADTITSWRLFLSNPLNIESVTNSALPNNLIFKDWRLKRGELFQAVKMEKNVMGLLISLIVIAFNIITCRCRLQYPPSISSPHSLLVLEKQGEVAILKTQGLSRLKIMLIFIIQGASSGIIGTLLGTILGVILALNLNDLMQLLHLSFAGITLPTLVEPKQVIIIIIGLLCLSLLSTLYPAYKAANIQPAEALRYE